jgi:hypothetical protein
MPLSFSESIANAMLNALTTEIAQQGTGKIILRIYGGAVPASVSTAVTNQPVLVTISKSIPFGNNASGKELAVLPFDSQAASATGDATFFRLFRESTESPLLQGTVSVAGGNGDLAVNKIAITQGETVSIETMKFKLP